MVLPHTPASEQLSKLVLELKLLPLRRICIPLGSSVHKGQHIKVAQDFSVVPGEQWSDHNLP